MGNKERKLFFTLGDVFKEEIFGFVPRIEMFYCPYTVNVIRKGGKSMNFKETFQMFIKGSEFKIHYNDPISRLKLTRALERKIAAVNEHRPIVVVCIGTDRSTGDSLGPLVGSRMTGYHDRTYRLYGTLDDPVHAVNLQDALEGIYRELQEPYVIAVDACLGRANNIGFITVADGPVLPGAGVKKNLPPVGDMHVTGVVNASGYMEYFVLQNTRLSLVMKMAEIIGDCLHGALQRRRVPYAKINIQ